MTRKQYLIFIAILIGAAIMVILSTALWFIGLIPALIYPRMFTFFSSDSVTYYMSKKIIRASMQGDKSRHERV